ncbi:DNA alkylation repair protein, partial [Leptospira ognonensis]
EILRNDQQDLIQRAVGSWIREAGKKDKHQLFEFLNSYADDMPRTMLNYATEKLEKKDRDYYKQRNKSGTSKSTIGLYNSD